MRPFIKERSSFFKSRDRVEKIKKWVEPEDKEDSLDLKMLAVLTRAAIPDSFAILMKLMDTFCGEAGFNPESDSRAWKEIDSLGLAPAFWKVMHQTFGYESGSSPGLMDFLIKIFVTDFGNNFKNDLPLSLGHFGLTDTARATNVSVFINQWQTHTLHGRNFNCISRHIAERLNLSEILSAIDIEDLMDVMTFEKVEQQIISSLRDRIIHTSHGEFSDTLEIIKKRGDGYWAVHSFNDDSNGNLYKKAYQALEIAVGLLGLRKKYDVGFHYPSALEMFKAYSDELYRFDLYYRQFMEIANQTEQAGWDVLKPLRQAMDDLYSGWFMERLSMQWGNFLAPDHSSHDKTADPVAPPALLDTWHLPGIHNQYRFFKNKVETILAGSDRSRIFVIISDAFRYEAAKELTTQINGKYRLKAQIEPMLGTLPSYTALGMAALLPHKILSFPESSASPKVDGKPAASLEQRSAILERHHGTAIKASELSEMSKNKGRDFVKQYRVIYIYHDQIDAMGDKAATEDRTFEAVRTAIDELTALVGWIINSLNGTRILITADHGFIYQEKKPDELDKSTLEMPPGSAVKQHKRFVLGPQPGASGAVFCGSTQKTAGTETDMPFLLPKGTNRFYFTGGARFFHGGAMLQEIVIPVITVSEMKGIHKLKSEIRKAGVSILGSPKKIVTNIPRFEFIQTDAVSGRVKPRVLKISLREGNVRISNEETITFDSISSAMEDRKKSVRLPLKSGPFDNKKEYALVLRNADDETEYDRIPMIIDIAFANDF